MAAPEAYTITQVPLVAHSFSPDRSAIALSTNSNEASIYARDGYEWQPISTLAQHDKLVTSIDWAPTTDRIVTCAQDRNAYVWTKEADPSNPSQIVWKPTLVVLKINRAATQVRWSPLENKFAVASGARSICVCSFDEEMNWWASKQLKKPIRSTVLSIDWHPNNVLLAAGSADMKARVFSTFLKEIDKKPPANVWGDKFPWNTVCGEYNSPGGGWVHAVGFSPSGDALAFAGHDSTITIVYPAAPAIITLKGTTLPYLTLTWTAEDALVAAGHDCQPVLFSGTPAGWKAICSLDDANGPRSSSFASSASTPRSATGPGGGGGPPVGRLNNAAFNRFREADSRGTSSIPGTPSSPGGSGLFGGSPTSGVGGDKELLTIHQNTITSVRPYEWGPNGNVTKVSTTGVDGKLVLWPVSTSGGLAPKMMIR
ncbi:hypothetical protein FRC19_011697 [Serendipita sp. 401]|nr:hypothetical protein FRC19_011697 [Serendipita sp. 401]KAG8831528.1 hypothetical protein FRC18_006357 [Serendipita sp. 400]